MASTLKQRLRRYNGTDYDTIYLSPNVGDAYGTLSTSHGGTGYTYVDSTPTSGSGRMCTSGGIYTAIQNAIGDPPFSRHSICTLTGFTKPTSPSTYGTYDLVTGWSGDDAASIDQNMRTAFDYPIVRVIVTLSTATTYPVTNRTIFVKGLSYQYYSSLYAITRTIGMPNSGTIIYGDCIPNSTSSVVFDAYKFVDAYSNADTNYNMVREQYRGMVSTNNNLQMTSWKTAYSSSASTQHAITFRISYGMNNGSINPFDLTLVSVEFVGFSF